MFQVKERAVELAKAMENEDGVAGAVQAFHKHFPRQKQILLSESKEKHRSHFSLSSCFRHHHE